MNKLRKILATLILLGAFLVPAVGLAEGGCTISQDRVSQFQDEGLACTSNCNFTTSTTSANFDCGTCCLLNTIYNVVDLAFLIIMAISVLAIIWGAVLFLKSGGSQEDVDNAKKTIMFAAIGIIVALLAKAVPSIVLSVVG